MSFQSSIEKFWYSKSFWKILLLPFSWIIQLLVKVKYFLYKTKIFKSYHFNVPVIVVGNITVGGTGKTPFITYLTRKFLEKNIKAGIVSRGYLSQAQSYPHIVSEQDDVVILGDETYMQYQRLKIPMAIGANRAKAIEALVNKYSLDVIISDDGLQHYAMARDFEVLMIDAQRQFGNQLMLPFGPLREPISRLKSVDYILFNGETEKNHLSNKGLEVSNGLMRIEVKRLIHLKSGEQVSLNNLSHKNLGDKKVCAIAAIGNPERFFKSLSDYVDSFEKVIFPDHHAFSLQDFSQIKSEILVMTEKDAVKCKEFAEEHWYYLQVEASLEGSVFQTLYSAIDNKVLLNKS